MWQCGQCGKELHGALYDFCNKCLNGIERSFVKRWNKNNPEDVQSGQFCSSPKCNLAFSAHLDRKARASRYKTSLYGK